MKNCKIVQDLLPNYIEKLTNEETNQYIKEHLKECEECSKKLNAMKSNIDIDKNNQLKKETKYLKKYSRKLRVFKFIVFAIILIFLVNVGRKMIIINSLQNKISQNENLEYYYVKCNWLGEGYNGMSEIYSKGGKYKAVSYDANRYGAHRMESYMDDQNSNIYNIRYDIDGFIYKYAFLKAKSPYDKTNLGQIVETCEFKTDNLYELILMALTGNISSEICNGKECYRVEKLMVMGQKTIPEIFYQDIYKKVFYIEKETGLFIRTIDRRQIEVDQGKQDKITDYEYDFGNIDDEVFKEPNIEEYTIQNIN